MHSTVPLGNILRRRNLVSEMQLAHALSLQQRTGSRLGDILIADGMIGYLALYQAVAAHYNLAFVNLVDHPPEAGLLREGDIAAYLRLQAIPWRRQDGFLHIAVCDPSEEVRAWVGRCFGAHTRLVVTSPFDIRRTVETHFAPALETSSRLALWETLPQSSARTMMTARQKDILFGALLIMLIALMRAPAESLLALLALCHLAFGATMIFKTWVFFRGMPHAPRWNWERRLALLDERKLPVYTVLVPMYREAASLPGLLDAMRRLDYPACKLDVKLVLEEDDAETLRAAQALKPRYQFEIIRVPAGTPRTKPRACNYALRFARGEIVTVFDADDRPERTQLKKAAYAFRTLPPEIVCLQARLNYYNASDNWLTRFFSLEYTILFHFMLRGLERLSIPIPLGGTSNHIALSRLKALGEWDPYNVTEDADLGARLAARGLKTAMLDSYTMEESPRQVMPWIRQRSRWIKGYMQTWLVHMRHPQTLYRTLGWKSFTGFQFFFGLSSFSFLAAPLVWGLSLLWASGAVETDLPDWLVMATLLNLALNLFTHWYCALYCALLYRKHWLPIMISAALYPLYLLLHSIASYKALWQLIVNPHFWEKTMHGHTRYSDLGNSESDLLRPEPALA